MMAHVVHTSRLLPREDVEELLQVLLLLLGGVFMPRFGAGGYASGSVVVDAGLYTHGRPVYAR
jgi:hypothetical protein